MTKDELVSWLLLFGFRKTVFDNVLRRPNRTNQVLEVNFQDALHQLPLVYLNIKGAGATTIRFYSYMKTFDHIKRIINYTRERT